MAATIAGSGSVTAVLTGTKLTVTGTFDGLKSPATIVQIHKAQRGVRGPVVLDLQSDERHQRHDLRDARSDRAAGCRICRTAGSTFSCTAKRRPTAICGDG